MRAALLVLLAACGGGHAARPAAPDEPADRVGGAPPSAEAVCERTFALRDAGCAMFQDFDLPHEECVSQLGRGLAAADEQARARFVQHGNCVLDYEACADVRQCFIDALDYRACDEVRLTSVAVGVPLADWRARKGADVRWYSEHASTREAPIEVCEVGGELDWLLTATCNDGSRPFATRQQAHAARTGNVGPGGRCHAIIDRYLVPCPDHTYALYFDAYVCPLPP